MILGGAAVLVLALAVAVGVRAATSAARAPVAPVVDLIGVPDVVTSGDRYDAVIRVEFPERWPMEHRTATDASPRALLGAWGRGTPEDEDGLDREPEWGEAGVIYCSTGVLDATARTVELDCPVTAPAAGSPWEVVVGVNAPDDDAWSFRYEFVREVREVREPAPGVGGGPGADVTASDAALIDAFVRFAQQPDRATADALPWAAGGVELGLGPTLVRTLPAQLVSDPEVWLLETDGFRARSGPVSALTVLQEHLAGPDGAQRLGTGLQTSVGEHPHCASPPVPAPAGLADARRVSVQPAEDSITTCLAWFSVDLFLADDGTVVAVTVDVYEP